MKWKYVIPVLLAMVLSLFFQNCAQTIFSDIKDSSSNGTAGSTATHSEQDLSEEYSKKISASTTGNSCAIRNGGVYCWGNNTNGQIGNNSQNDAIRPYQTISEGSGATQVVTEGVSGGCALVNEGVQCWGTNTTGLGQYDYALTPRWIEGLPAWSGVKKIFRGNHPATACALKSDGLWCWGKSSNGEIVADQDYVAQPIKMQDAPSNIDQVIIGKSYLCLSTIDKKIFCKGTNQSGQLGQGMSSMGSLYFVEVENIDGAFTKIFTNGNTTCTLSASGVSCWGGGYLIPYNGGATVNGQTGFIKMSESSAKIDFFGSDIKSMSISDASVCIIKTNKKVFCAGYNNLGQIGNGQQGPDMFVSQLTEVLGLPENVLAVTNGATATCAISKDDRIFCWGSNFDGDLGVDVPNSSMSFSSVPLELNKFY